MKRWIAVATLVLLSASFEVSRFQARSQRADKWMLAHSKTPRIWEQQAEWHFATEPDVAAWVYGNEGFRKLPYCEDIGRATGSCVYRNIPKEDVQ